LQPTIDNTGIYVKMTKKRNT